MNLKRRKMKKRFFIIAVISIFALNLKAQNPDAILSSPDKKLNISVYLTQKIYFSVDYLQKNILLPSPIALKLEDKTLGVNPKLLKKNTKTVDNELKPLWGEQAVLKENYNELRLDFEGDYSIIFRAYNEGIAYRFVTDIKGEIKVIDEEMIVKFAKSFPVNYPDANEVKNLQTSFEMFFERKTIGAMKVGQLTYSPVLVELDDNARMLIAESDLFSYPGMFLRKYKYKNELKGEFAAYPTKTKIGGWNHFNKTVTERENYIAKVNGKRNFPWRAFLFAETDKDLITNELVYLLAAPNKLQTTDWIKPGRSAWEWWNDWNLTGVDFETGVNTKTYEYYIDFAAKNNIEYLVVDEGWSDVTDLLILNPEIDIKHLVKYANKKNVGLLLWCVWHELDEQIIALDSFQNWGVKGIKVDFIDRDDQVANEFYENLAIESGKRKLIINYHGCGKPAGIYRTYPNVVNFEGVRGNEYNKFDDKGTTAEHNVNLVFTRNVVGPMDYTPGGMRNIRPDYFKKCNAMPQIMTTRCHQLGMYVVYSAPLQMFCDAPTEYEKYPDILKFLSKVPVNWDKTVPLDAKYGDYAIVARQKGNEWYVGGLNDDTKREIEIDFSFLGDKNYAVEIFKDGVNAEKNPTDYKVIQKDITKKSTYKIILAPCGGFAMRITEK